MIISSIFIHLAFECKKDMNRRSRHPPTSLTSLEDHWISDIHLGLEWSTWSSKVYGRGIQSTKRTEKDLQSAEGTETASWSLLFCGFTYGPLLHKAPVLTPLRQCRGGR